MNYPRDDIGFTIEVIILLWLEMMFLKITEMILSVFLAIREKRNEDPVPEMILNIPVVRTSFMNGIQ